MRETSDIENKGRELSRWAAYDGIVILQSTINALTDANFHQEADLLIKVVEAIEEMGDVTYKLECEQR